MSAFQRGLFDYYYVSVKPQTFFHLKYDSDKNNETQIKMTGSWIKKCIPYLWQNSADDAIYNRNLFHKMFYLLIDKIWSLELKIISYHFVGW